MTLLELHADVSRVADALEKIVFLLEKLVFPPVVADVRVTQATLDDLHIVTPESTAEMSEEQMRFAEIHRVVPGSEAFARELLDWEAEQRSIRGEDWKAPEWAEIFASAYGGGRAVRQPSDASSSSAERR